MNPRLFLLFNHQITELQTQDARDSLGVKQILEPPEHLKERWKNVPPDLMEIAPYFLPVKEWLENQARAGDYLLVQGDFGATYLMVCFALENGIIPIYSTTERRVEEQHEPDGRVRLSHTFLHRRFRRYGE